MGLANLRFGVTITSPLGATTGKARHCPQYVLVPLRILSGCPRGASWSIKEFAEVDKQLNGVLSRPVLSPASVDPSF